MFSASFRRCLYNSGKLMTLAATAAPLVPEDTKSAEEYEWAAPEASALRTYVVTPSREFVWNAIDTAKAAQTSFSEGFTNTTHKAAGSVDITQVREAAKSTREFLDRVPGVVTVGASALLPLLLLRRSPLKALFASTLFGGIAASQVYPEVLDTGARRLIDLYKSQINPPKSE